MPINFKDLARPYFNDLDLQKVDDLSYVAYLKEIIEKYSGFDILITPFALNHQADDEASIINSSSI